MGTIADSLFSALMSWVRALVGDLWAIFSSERTTILEFLGKHWIGIALLMIAIGLAVDWLIWLVRWQPYHLWAQRVRRLLRIESPDDGEQEVKRKAHAARMPERPRYERPAREEDWLPLRENPIGEEDAQRALRQAEDVPDASLTPYPGMRYDGQRAAAQAQSAPLPDLSAVHSEGPGAAVVEQRRAEIDAWQLQMQQEAREKAEAERAQRAQERYRQQMEQYEREMAQYRRDLAEYERQKAAYDAQKSAYDAQKAAADAQGGAHRRAPQPAPEPQPETAGAPEQRSTLMGRMANVMRQLEPEETEVNAIASLPPRVDVRDAYAPAAHPRRGSRRGK